VSAFSFYEGPRALLYRCVWVTGLASAALLIAVPVLNHLTPNDFSIGLLLSSAQYFALGLGALASLFFLLLLFCRDVPLAVKLRALAAVSLPYIVVGVLYAIATSSVHAPR
jgi:hypothetical protein